MMYIYSLEKDNASLFWAATLDSTEVENSFNNLRLLTRFLSHMPTVPSLFSVLDSPSLVLVVLGNASPILPFSALTQKGNQTTAQPIFLSLSLFFTLTLTSRPDSTLALRARCPVHPCRRSLRPPFAVSCSPLLGANQVNLV